MVASLARKYVIIEGEAAAVFKLPLRLSLGPEPGERSAPDDFLDLPVRRSPDAGRIASTKEFA